MLAHPRLAPAFQWHPHDADGVLLVAEDRYRILPGTVYRALLPLLDGTHTPDELVQHLAGLASATEVYYALMQLEDAGYLVNGTAASPELLTFWGHLRVDPATAQHRLHTQRVEIVDLFLDALSFAERLVTCGVQTGAPADLRVVLTPDYLHPNLEAFNRIALATDRPWMLVKPSGVTPWLGPLFNPGETGCWHCLAHRLRGNRPDALFAQQHQHTYTPFPTLPSIAAATRHQAVTEILRWLAQPNDHPLAGCVHTLDVVNLKREVHQLTRRPQCPVCGTAPTPDSPTPVALQSQPVIYALDGGLRITPPETTLATYAHHVSPITGVIRSLQRVETPNDALIHSYTASHAMHLSGITLGVLRYNTRDHSGGKGCTDVQAKTSGLCESLERYSSVFDGSEPRRRASLVQLGPEAIHPNTCMLFSDVQYAERDAWNAQQGVHFQYVPPPFDPETEIDWTPVWSLTHRTHRYLPTAYCYFGYTSPSTDTCTGDSNGLAAGNTLEEAFLQGFMELVERDAVALWWYNRTCHPALDLHNFKDAYLDDVVAYHATLGRSFWVLDVTSDLGVPVCVALSAKTDDGAEDILMGFGAHFDVRIALKRAVTEVNQSLPTVMRPMHERARQLLPDFAAALNWWATATRENQPYLCPASDAWLPPDAFPTHTVTDLREEAYRCIDLAARHGLETLVLEQTRPDIGLPVAKVFVPGLRHFWKRLAPGRLYDIPVALGRLPAPLDETALNPLPLFL